MARADCQNDEFILSLATKVGRQAYFLGMDLTTRFTWHCREERIAFMKGWLTAERGARVSQLAGQQIAAD